MSDLFMPLNSRDWSSPQVKYTYIPPKEGVQESGFGRFSGAGGAEVFAPEAGLLMAAGDGTFMLSVEGGKREWFFLNKLAFDFKKDEVVRAGTKMGLSEGPLLLALVEGGKPVDPAQYLIKNGGKFVNLVGPGVAGRRRRDSDSKEIEVRRETEPFKTSRADGGSNAPESEIVVAAPKKSFTAPQVVGIAVGATLVGGAIMWAAKGR